MAQCFDVSGISVYIHDSLRHPPFCRLKTMEQEGPTLVGPMHLYSFYGL